MRHEEPLWSFAILGGPVQSVEVLCGSVRCLVVPTNDNCEVINHMLTPQWRPQELLFDSDRPICTDMPIS